MMKKIAQALNKVSHALAGLLIVLALYYTLHFPSIIHEELANTANSFMHHDEDPNILRDLISKSFNLCALEECGYRPRILAFIINYIDINLSHTLQLHFHTPFILPLTLLSIPLIWAAIYSAIRNIGPEIPTGTASLIAALTLYHQGIQASLHVWNRSAKLLSVAAMAWLIAYYFRRKTSRQRSSTWATGLSLFCLFTLDEQLLALGFIGLALLAMPTTPFAKKIAAASSTLIGLALYIVFYFWIGRFLFDFFTPGSGFNVHTHNPIFLEKLFLDNNVLTNYAGYTLLIMSASLSSLLGSFYGLAITVIYCYLMVATGDPDEAEKRRAFILFTGSLILMLVMCFEHPPIVTFRDLNTSLYTTIPVLMILFATILSSTYKNKIIPQKLSALFITIILPTLMMRGVIDAESASRHHAYLFGGHIQHTYTVKVNHDDFEFIKAPLEGTIWVR